jgi:hypothetical protein
VRDDRRHCRVCGSNDEIQSTTTAMSRKTEKLSQVAGIKKGEKLLGIRIF